MWNLKKKRFKGTCLQNRRTQRLGERTHGCRGEGTGRSFRADMDTWITNKVLLYSTGNSAQYYLAAWMERELGGEWTGGWIAMLPPQTITTLLTHQAPFPPFFLFLQESSRGLTLLIHLFTYFSNSSPHLPPAPRIQAPWEWGTTLFTAKWILRSKDPINTGWADEPQCWTRCSAFLLHLLLLSLGWYYHF